ncbi:MAG: GNAT family N-acetyltransferase [Clostridia bacterium]|nr:GNAT family N-acetyltransferase [Clostridia bacterium]
MLIRKAAADDIEAVAEIYSNIHTAEENGLVTIGWIRDVYPTAETAKQALLRGDLFVMEDNGIIVGTAIINKTQVDSYKNARWNHPAPDDKVMVLHTLVISPKASRKGYGKNFVAFYEQYACQNGCPYLRMDTNAKNTRARNMYQKLGYEEIGIVPCSFNGIDGVNLVLLEKLLPDNI